MPFSPCVKMPRLKWALLGILCASSWLTPAAEALAAHDSSPSYRLDKVVTLSRHGVRPQGDTQKLDQATGKQWPVFGVPDGFLTGHGYMGIAQQGAHELADWRGRGLKLESAQGCPLPNQLWVWADVDQRTRATGKALLDGMFPGCGLMPQWSTQWEDPIFSEASMGLSPLDTHKVRQQVMARMGGSPQAASQHYAKAVATLRRAVCAENEKACAFMDEPWGVEFKKSGKAKLTGPVSQGSTISETIREQYSENLPLAQVAFGHAPDAGAVKALMALHAAKYDLLSDTPEYARHGGSILLGQLMQALQSDSRQDTEAAPLARPLVMFVGHDTNIAQIQTLLGFNWQLPGYPRNDIPPGGSLEFQRYHNTQDGSEWVRIIFRARTLDEWRRLSEPSHARPLPLAEYKGAGCRSTAVGELCPLHSLVTRAQRQRVQLAKPPTLYR